MKVTIVEGSPEEILAAFPHLREAASSPVTPSARPPAVESNVASEDGSANENSGSNNISIRVARKVLTRRPLKPLQRIVLKEIYEAHPKLVLATDLHKKTGYTPAQFAGLMGAIGRRVSHTEGYVNGDQFFTYKWDDKAQCWSYGLPEAVREALKLEKVV